MAIKEIKLIDKRSIPLGFKLSINNKSSHPLQFIKNLKSEHAMIICNCFSRTSIYKFNDLIQLITTKYKQPPEFQGARVMNIPIEKFTHDSIKIEESAGIPKRFRGNISDLFLFGSDFELYLDIIGDKYKFLQEHANEIYLITKGGIKEIIGFRFDKHIYIVNRRLWRNWTEIICDEITRQVLTYYLYTYLYDTKVPSIKPRKNYLTLGTDPEFLIYKKNKKEPQLPDYKRFVRAQTVLKGHTDSAVGVDGCNDVGEIRPQHAHEPKDVTKNIKRLLAHLDHELSSSGNDYFVEVGGGCQLPIGGHIHIGHPILNDLSNEELNPLLTMLDDFLYYPMKANMIGALRHWRNLEWQPSTRYDRAETYGNIPADSKAVQEVAKNTRRQSDICLSDYEAGSLYRRKDAHGIEYRSLPSFIIDETFTQLIFKITQQITLKFFHMLKTQQAFKYNNPPIKKDYRHFLTKKEINTFFGYLVGQNKEKFLKNTLDEWKLTDTKDVYLTLHTTFESWFRSRNLTINELIPEIENRIPSKLKTELIKRTKVVPIGLFSMSPTWDLYKNTDNIIGINYFTTANSLYPLLTKDESFMQEVLKSDYNILVACFVSNWMIQTMWNQGKNASINTIASLVIDLLKYSINPTTNLEWTTKTNRLYRNKIQAYLKNPPKTKVKKSPEREDNFRWSGIFPAEEHVTEAFYVTEGPTSSDGVIDNPSISLDSPSMQPMRMVDTIEREVMERQMNRQRAPSTQAVARELNAIHSRRRPE